MPLAALRRHRRHRDRLRRNKARVAPSSSVARNAEQRIALGFGALVLGFTMIRHNRRLSDMMTISSMSSTLLAFEWGCDPLLGAASFDGHH
jgi:hypothetical protein